MTMIIVFDNALQAEALKDVIRADNRAPIIIHTTDATVVEQLRARHPKLKTYLVTIRPHYDTVVCAKQEDRLFFLIAPSMGAIMTYLRL